jgi:two-component system LytT family sensor kinase
MKVNWQLNKNSILVLHALVWVMIFLLPFIYTSENDSSKDTGELAFRNLKTVTNLFWMGLFYLNALVLIPKLFNKHKYIYFVFSLVLSFCIIMLFHGALFKPFVQGHDFNFFRSSAHNIIPFLFTVTVSTTYKIIYDKIKADTVAAEIQKENLKTELSFLRSQISPHFLFNVLNNIVAMVRLKSDELEPTVIKLSSLLQYMLYETDEEKVLLGNEEESLQNYIDLQRIRFSSKLTLNTSFDVKEEWHTIEPMLLIPFVENAFKHGNGLLNNPEIDIDLQSSNNQLDFFIKNKYVSSDTAKDKTSGIGLTNVKRRLQLLYPEKHTLLIEDNNGWYQVHLKLFLK